MKIIARINFIFNGDKYIKGEEVKVKNINQVYKLNELGYINPLTYEQLVLIERQLRETLLNNEARKNDFDGY